MDYLSFQILPAHLLGNLGVDQLVDHPFNLAPIGSGPYRFDSLETENVITGELFLTNITRRNFIDKFRFRYYPDEKAAPNAYRRQCDSQNRKRGPGSSSKSVGLVIFSRQPGSIVFINLRDASAHLTGCRFPKSTHGWN